MLGTVRIAFSIETTKRGSEVSGTLQYDEDDWNSLTPEEKEEEVRQQAFNYLN